MARSKQDEEHLIVFRGKHAFVVMNLYPYNSGHLMIVPYRHLRDMSRLTDRENGEILQLANRSMKALRKVSGPQGYNFGANIGRAAGAGIDEHIHFHVVPRWVGDTNFLPVLAETKLVSEDTHRTWQRLFSLFHSRPRR